jgi:asparagine synthase (glutamine-hydrolysing)
VCGIFGASFQDAGQVPSEARLRETSRLLRHRGPDADGIFAAPGLGFAHARLTFLDVDARSNQPLWDATGRYCVIFNGEIYNYKELRRSLEGEGASFRTTSDTEVLLQCLIRQEPRSAIRSLQGMFAFAFYDTVDRTLILARDRFGMKPLYVYEDERVFLFSSEIKALAPWWTPELDSFSIGAYLLGFGGPTKGATFYRALQSVPPGTMIVRRPGCRSESAPFFELPEFWSTEMRRHLEGLSATAVVNRLEELLTESVKRHMFADVRVGAFCSGGVDSSLLMAIAARQYTDLGIFHANVKGQWSEQQAAAALARHLKLDLKTVDVTDDDFIDRIPDVTAHYEHPFTYHPNCAPLLMVSELARDNGVKGLLSGEGSDECFLGYPWLGRKRLVDSYYGLGRRVRDLVHRIPDLGRIAWPAEDKRTDVVRDLMNRREIADDRARIRQTAGEFRAPVAAEDLWTMDYLGHHLRTLLHRNDTMGMAASVEARFPFLDHDVVAFAANLPAQYKLRASATALEKAHPFIRDKWVVRQVADRYVPKALSQRTKLGFWTTVFKRMRVEGAYFDDSFVASLFGLSAAQMRASAAEADEELTIRLLLLDAWGRICVEGRTRDDVRRRIREHSSVRAE